MGCEWDACEVRCGVVWCGAVRCGVVFHPRIRFNRHRAVRQLEVRERCFERVSSLELRRSYAQELSVWLWLGLGLGGLPQLSAL